MYLRSNQLRITKIKSFSVYFSVLRMGGDIDVDKLNARKRLIILLIIDSLIVFFSIFVCYEILEPYFKIIHQIF